MVGKKFYARSVRMEPAPDHITSACLWMPRVSFHLKYKFHGSGVVRHGEGNVWETGGDSCSVAIVAIT